MCGLVGIYSNSLLTDPEVQLFKNLLLVDQIRGYHATGIIKVDVKDNTAHFHKAALDAVDFLAMESTKDFLNKNRGHILIGHNRYATMGSKSDHANAHPFNQDHITLVHNGGVDSWGLDQLEGHDDKSVAVDSHMVTMTIAKHGIKKAVTEHLSGAFALVWWDSKERSLNFIRNSDRPLYLASTTSGSLVWASERGMLDVFLKREGRATGYRLEPTMLPVNQHYKFLFDEKGARIGGTGPVVEEMSFLELAIPKSQAAWGDYYGTSYRGAASYQKSSVGNSIGYKTNTQEDRVNKLLNLRGIPLRHGQVITADFSRLEAYEHNPAFGRVFAKDRKTGREVEAWGVRLADLDGITTLGMTIENSYEISRLGKIELVIGCKGLFVSCHDPRHNQLRGRNIETMSSIKTASKKVVPIQHGRSVQFPLKTFGHTFNSSDEFVDFVSKGCSFCGKIPTPYDRRNHNLTVVEGRSFGGLLDDCDFICGECIGEI